MSSSSSFTSSLFNIVIMWCSWKVFVCRHDSGDVLIACIISIIFYSQKVHLKCYTKHFECGVSKPALRWIRHKNRATTMTAVTTIVKEKNQIRATIVRMFTSSTKSIFNDGKDHLKKMKKHIAFFNCSRCSWRMQGEIRYLYNCKFSSYCTLKWSKRNK